jgi:hypothetical protein
MCHPDLSHCNAHALSVISQLLLTQTVPLYLAIEGRRVDAEDRARPFLLPVRLLEHRDEVFLLELVERHLRLLHDDLAALLRMVAHLLGKILRADVLSVLEDARALDDVLELADVAGPIVVREELHRFLRYRPRPAGTFGGQMQEPVDEERDIVAPLAQRRYDDRNHVETVIEVRAEALLLHRFLEIGVRRRDETHVHLDGRRRG